MATYKIIIDHTKVAADLTDFPVYINLADMPTDFWTTVTSGGGDIRCYDIDDNELAREVVSCDTTLQSGELHVKANLSSTVPTILKISIDGTSSDYLPTDTYGRNAVWSNGYVGVWHLDNLTDSSGHSNNLSVSGTSTVTAGRVGHGRHVTSGGMLPTGNDVSLQLSKGALSAWVRTTELTSQGNDRSAGVIIKELAWGIYIDQGYLGTYQWAYPQRYETSPMFVADGD